VAQGEHISSNFEDRLPKAPVSRDIDSKFHASKDFQQYGLTEYTMGFFQA